ncbi:MAG: DUF4058 family protein [Anaerolineae bacterium]|nr:DUF4058 family protein [Anaerolineae bacterium]
MPSPFPGMDPYLEGYLWPDVHLSLIYKLKQLLVPVLRPKYTVRVEISLYADPVPEGEIGVSYPDVDVLLSQSGVSIIGSLEEPESFSQGPLTPATLTIPLITPREVHVPSLEIRDTSGNLLVSTIEILSPVNKRGPNLTHYRRKRLRLHDAGVHLLELDLLRRGQRPIVHPRLPETSYLIALTRAGRGVTHLWPIGLRDRLPVVPLPLKEEDDDVALDLPAVLNAVYDDSAYNLSINYHEPPPPPPLSSEDQVWVASLVSGK